MNNHDPTPVLTAPHGAPAAGLVPCWLAVSSNYHFGGPESADTVTRRWRALGLDGRSELFAGQIQTSAADPLAIVRDQAVELARRHGYEPQRFVLEQA